MGLAGVGGFTVAKLVNDVHRTFSLVFYLCASASLRLTAFPGLLQIRITDEMPPFQDPTWAGKSPGQAPAPLRPGSQSE